MFAKSLYCIAILALVFAGCRGKDDDKNKSRPNDGGEVDGGTTAPDSGGTDTGGATTGGDEPPQVGELLIDLTDARAIGVAQLDGQANLEVIPDQGISAPAGTIILGLQGAPPSTTLTKVTSDGSLIGLSLPNAGGWQPEIKQLHQFPGYGAFIEFAEPGYFPDFQTSMALVDTQGRIRPFMPTGYTDIFYPAPPNGVQIVDSKAWFITVNTGFLFNFDFITQAFTQFTGTDQFVRNFYLPSDGSVHIRVGTNTNGSVANEQLQRLKPDGGIETYRSPSGGVDIDNSTTFGSLTVSSNRVARVNDQSDTLEFYYLPEDTFARASGESGEAFKAGEYLVSYNATAHYAYNLVQQNVAGNPMRVQGMPGVADSVNKPETFHGNVDTPNGIYFDGANLVKMGVAADGQVTSTLHRKLVYPNGQVIKIARVFGPDHGFNDHYVALAHAPRPTEQGQDDIYYVEIDSASGRVDLNSLALIGLPGLNILDNKAIPREFPQYATLYEVGNRLIMLTEIPQYGVLELVADGDEYDLVLRMEGNASGIPNTYGLIRSQAFAFVNGDQLLIGDWGGIHIYEPSVDDSDMTFRAAGQFAAIVNEGASSCASGRRWIGFINTGTSKPGAIMRACGDNDADDEGDLLYIAFTDMNLTAYEPSSAIQLDRPIPPNVNGLMVQANVEIVRDSSSTRMALFDRGTGQFWQLTGGTRSATTQTASDLMTTGLYTFGTQFPDSSDGLYFANAWGNGVLYSGQYADNRFASHRLNLANGSDTEVSQLNGIQVFSATQVDGTLLVNGLRLADNNRVTVSFAADGSYLGTEAESNVKILQLIPFGE